MSYGGSGGRAAAAAAAALAQCTGRRPPKAGRGAAWSRSGHSWIRWGSAGDDSDEEICILDPGIADGPARVGLVRLTANPYHDPTRESDCRLAVAVPGQAKATKAVKASLDFGAS